ncbi:MAG: hypothetical protein HW386_2221, partial [Gammaproteobacteria bacterium]|nr:hypothetical protein [Gammaproteobacteria bacterium]
MPINRVAMPRKLKKPMTSVTVVRKIEEEVAGSCPSLVSSTGIMAPDMEAIIIDRIME